MLSNFACSEKRAEGVSCGGVWFDISLDTTREMSPRWRPQCISFSGGGARSIGHMGVLIRLMEEDILSDVRAWYGTSGGSMAAILGALGVSVGWLRSCAEYFDTHPMLDIQEDLVAHFMTEWGVDYGNKYVEYMGRFLNTWEPGFSEWTFAQLSAARPGILLGIPAVNLSTGEYVLFSSTTHPHMKIFDAVRATSSIPMFFTPWKDDKGHLYCDGALKEQYPWACIPKEKRSTTLMIACHENQIGVYTHAPISTFTDYISRIMYIARHNHQQDAPEHTIVINDTRIDILDFFQRKEERLCLIQSGIDAVAAWVMQHSLAENSETHPLSSVPDTLPSARLVAQDRELDIPQSQNPQPSRGPSQGLHISSQQISRRWSL